MTRQAVRRGDIIGGSTSEEPTPGPAPSSWPNGYRMVRLLGVGSRSRVYLAHPGDASRSVALKVFDGDGGCADSDTELAACAATDSSHVVRLLDIGSGAPTPTCAVLEWLSGGCLTSLLGRSERIRPGEAVTILVSVLRGIRALHRAGFAHGAVGTRTVQLDGTGRPVLIGLGHAVRREDCGSAAFSQAQHGDWAGFATVSLAVFDRVDGEGRHDELRRITGAVERLCGERGEDAVDDVESALFELDQAAPIRFGRGDGEGAPDRHEIGGRRRPAALSRPALAPALAPSPRPPAPASRPASRPVADSGPVRGVAVRLEALWDAGPVRMLLQRLAPYAIARKKQLIVAAATACGLALLGLAALPPTHARAPAPHATSPQHPQEPVASAHRTTDAAPAGQNSGAAVTADDPVAATGLLLAERSRCITAASARCLDDVDQADSAQLDADRAALAAAHDQAKHQDRTDYATFTVSLIQRIGGSALVELTGPTAKTTPASALVVKGEAGWRLRQIFEN